MKVVLDELTKIFPPRNGKGKSVTAVKDFTYVIPDGTLVALLGPSGCGKSTILNMICGLEKPTQGKIFFGNDEVTNISPELRGVGMVFQNYALYPHMTVYENIIFPLGNLKGSEKLTKEQMKEKADKVASLVQVEELMQRKPGELSGGQQQRVAIARALIKTPKLLLMDEPLSNLDARLRLQTREEIRRIQRETGVTTVFVTHDQEEAMSISDLIVVMKDGELHQSGKPQEVYDDPANLFVAKFLGTPAINTFNGRVLKEKLIIGEDIVLDVPGVRDGDVIAGIRPEGFIYDKDNGVMHNLLDRVEVMGRDISIVSKNPECEEPVVRSIIDSDERPDENTAVASFRLRPNKVHLFDPKTGERLRFGKVK